jgi:uncharacterized protein (TIGR02996 family)
MSDHDALLAAIQAAPDDDAPRLIYADWLEEHGDAARAEFIRVQVELDPFERPDGDLDRWRRAVIRKNPSAPLPDDFPTELQRYAALVAREQELLKAHRFQWYGPMSRGDEDYEAHLNIDFRRGFVDEVGITASAFYSFGDAIREASPLLRRLVLYAPRGELPELVALPALAGIPELELAGWITEFDARFLRTFLAKNVVRSLTMWLGSRYDLEIFRTLATSLWEDSVHQDSGLLTVLATRTYLAHLQELILVELYPRRVHLRHHITNHQIVEEFNRRIGRPVARLDRRQKRRFPLRERIVPRLWAGYIDQACALASLRSDSLVVVFNDENRIDRTIRLFLNSRPDFASERNWELREARALKLLQEEYGFVPGTIFAPIFSVSEGTEQLSLRLWGSSEGLIAEPDLPMGDVELEDTCATLHNFWMKGNFVLQFGNSHWIGPDGTVID